MAKGKETKGYAPSGDPLTLVIGPTESANQCRQALNQLEQENTYTHDFKTISLTR